MHCWAARCSGSEPADVTAGWLTGTLRCLPSCAAALSWRCSSRTVRWAARAMWVAWWGSLLVLRPPPPPSCLLCRFWLRVARCTVPHTRLPPAHFCLPTSACLQACRPLEHQRGPFCNGNKVRLGRARAHHLCGEPTAVEAGRARRGVRVGSGGAGPTACVLTTARRPPTPPPPPHPPPPPPLLLCCAGPANQ